MIIFINGSINAGKSTVSKILQEKLPRAALVELDSVRAFIGWVPIDEAIPTVHEVGADIVKSFAKNDFTVIIPYPLTNKSYEKFIGKLGEVNTKIYAFTLGPRLEEAITNRGARELDKNEVKRINYHYKIGINDPGYGVVIDNSDQTPEETADIILNHIERASR